jgi:hypothetical protein
MSDLSSDHPMLKDHSYPDVTDEEFQRKIYEKREFYSNRMPERSELVEYQDIQRYRDAICGGTFKLQAQQSFLSNYINPDTPFRGVLIYHGVGTGKCLHPGTPVLINGTYVPIGYAWARYAKDPTPDGWADPRERLTTRSINENQEEVIGLVSKLYREHVDGELRTVRLKKGKSITMTKHHMLFREREGEPVGFSNDLCPGDRVLLQFGVWGTIASVEHTLYKGYVYDLEVKTHHNYMADGFVSHNTCSAIAICENFKDMIKKYNTKIYILVPGPLNKESWKNELIKCTKETYYNDVNAKFGYVDPSERQRQEAMAKNVALQYYRIMSYRGFYKKVLGQKIIEKQKDESGRKTYRKTDEGEYERDISIDRIDQLNNTVLVVDEAHNMTGNEYGMALDKIIKSSKNLRVVLLTATPMKNLADDIVELVNYLRPEQDPLQRERVFTADKNHLMEIKPGGLEYLKRMTQGYVSHYRGMDPLTFAVQRDQGEVPDEILFTPVVRCPMEAFQLEAYNQIKEVSDSTSDALERRSAAVANFAIPGWDATAKQLQPLSGRDGLGHVRNQLRTTKTQLLEAVKKRFFPADVDTSRILSETPDGATITGLIFKQPYLKNFSTKFDRCLTTLMELVEGKKGAGTAFVYSNLVKSGIELFEQVLQQNGCVAYRDDGQYNLGEDTRDAITGLTLKEFKAKGIQRKFYPMAYVTITGQSEETRDVNTEEKTKVLYRVFNQLDNVDGKRIKFVLGSKVMNEGITLENVREVHVLDVYFNLGKVYQVIGRAIRHCVHYRVTSQENPFPTVDVYRYTISLPDSRAMSSEEQLYVRAEKKYMLIKKVERALKEASIDCPLNYNGNVYPEEANKYDQCVHPEQKRGNEGGVMCPAICDFDNCRFQCDDKSLNLKYYDRTTKMYKKIPTDTIDYTTFSSRLANGEISQAKERIKRMYRIRYVYTLDEIMDTVYNGLSADARDLFDPFFVYKALDDLIPVDENDFNNYKDTIYDKHNVPGYLIFRDRFYIFQPFNQNENVTMYYRGTYQDDLNHEISVQQFLEGSNIQLDNDAEAESSGYFYNMGYYEAKPDFTYVGIIDKQSARKREVMEELEDVFKLRPKREKDLDKKRGVGIPSLKGAVCHTSKDKGYLDRIAKEIGIKDTKSVTRMDICEVIRQRLLFLEKYTEGTKDRFTYMIIPTNHKTYPFPLNLEDRVAHIKESIVDVLPRKVEVAVKRTNNGIFEGTRDKSLARYELTIAADASLEPHKQALLDLGFKVVGKSYQMVVE